MTEPGSKLTRTTKMTTCPPLLPSSVVPLPPFPPSLFPRPSTTTTTPPLLLQLLSLSPPTPLSAPHCHLCLLPHPVASTGGPSRRGPSSRPLLTGQASAATASSSSSSSGNKAGGGHILRDSPRGRQAERSTRRGQLENRGRIRDGIPDDDRREDKEGRAHRRS